MKPKSKTLIRDIAIAILIITICIFAYAFYNRTQLILKQEQFTFEYGQKVDLTHEKFLELDKDEKRKEDIVKNTKIQSDFVILEGKDYPQVGEYEVIFTFGKVEKTAKIMITDTVSPSIISPKSIEMIQNDSIEEKELNKYFHSQDLSESKLTFDTTQYDKSKVGNQTIRVVSNDIYNNQTTKDYTIQNIKKPDINKFSTETVVEKDDNDNVSKVYIKKIEKAFELNVKLYCQHDVGARQGCDLAALYQALKYKGYCQNVSLMTFIKDTPLSYDGNPSNGFSGNPFEKHTLPYLNTIFPQPMTSWAKKYGNVSNFSGKSVDDIINELRNNNPVVVWVPYNFQTPRWTSGSYGKMYTNIHCFTVSGYNSEAKKIRVSDPGGSRNHRWISLSDFTRSYNYKKFAVVVR